MNYYGAPYFLDFLRGNENQIFFILSLVSVFYMFGKLYFSALWKNIALMIGINILFHSPEIYKGSFTETTLLIFAMLMGGFLTYIIFTS